MVKLFCAIIGAAGSAFDVDIDESTSESALKKAIKVENSDDPMSLTYINAIPRRDSTTPRRSFRTPLALIRYSILHEAC